MMRKTIACLFISFLVVQMTSAQVHKGLVDSTILPKTGSAHYEPEYTLDVPANAASWTNKQAGLHAAFGSEDNLYFRTEVPEMNNETAAWAPTGWRGERLNTQIVVWSADTLNQVRFTISDLKNAQGKVLSKNNFQINMVRYVLANYPYGSAEATCGGTPYKNGFLMPDRFEPFQRFDIPGKTVRPVWIAFNIPAETSPGIYTGSIKIQDEKTSKILPVKIKVQNQLLPKPHDWKFRLDIWQNPWIIAEYYHVKPWGAEHKALLKKHLQLYADAGGKYITTYGVHSPWANNEYAIEGGMIEWVKQKDHSWKFDYSIFDQYVELAMSVGIDKAITIYTPVPWGERFRYLDAATGNYVYEQWLPTSDTFKTNWNAFLTDLKVHLKKKGWFNKTYLGINENAMEQTLAAIKVIKKHSPEWRITYAGDWHQQLDTLLDDYCFLYGNEANEEQVKARAARGQTTTYYVCCNPAKPNNFVFSPPIEGRWISWYSAAHGYNGFLRWAYDSWPADPMRDARYGSWPAGDCFLVYPGGNSSIRFEKLREGIADYEKIMIIRGLAAKSTDKAVKNGMAAFDEHLETFNAEKEFKEDKLKEDLEKGKKMIDDLSERLAK
jgi:Domain of unknown function (DUF4091)/Family of unknown function (DUF6067)